jgi:hypothetical protein
MLGEINHAYKGKYHMILLIESKKVELTGVESTMGVTKAWKEVE